MKKKNKQDQNDESKKDLLFDANNYNFDGYLDLESMVAESKIDAPAGKHPSTHCAARLLLYIAYNAEKSGELFEINQSRFVLTSKLKSLVGFISAVIRGEHIYGSDKINEIEDFQESLYALEKHAEITGAHLGNLQFQYKKLGDEFSKLGDPLLDLRSKHNSLIQTYHDVAVKYKVTLDALYGHTFIEHEKGSLNRIDVILAIIVPEVMLEICKDLNSRKVQTYANSYIRHEDMMHPEECGGCQQSYRYTDQYLPTLRSMISQRKKIWKTPSGADISDLLTSLISRHLTDDYDCMFLV